jgi:hypothetical protein
MTGAEAFDVKLLQLALDHAESAAALLSKTRDRVTRLLSDQAPLPMTSLLTVHQNLEILHARVCAARDQLALVLDRAHAR